MKFAANAGDRKLYQSDVVPDGSWQILRAVVGSTIHGTNLVGSDDTDEMAIVIEPPDCVIGLREWATSSIRTKPDGERSMPGDLDLVVHSLRKYCRLAAGGNPSILLPLFVPKHGIVHADNVGLDLRLHRNMFLSKRCGVAFLGYMHAQLKRLKGESGGRHGAPRPELVEKYGFDTKYAGHVIRLGLQGIELMLEGTLSLPMRMKDRQEVLDVRQGKYTLPQVIERGLELENQLHDIIDNKTQLPLNPQWRNIDAFLVESYSIIWETTS